MLSSGLWGIVEGGIFEFGGLVLLGKRVLGGRVLELGCKLPGGVEEIAADVGGI